MISRFPFHIHSVIQRNQSVFWGGEGNTTDQTIHDIARMTKHSWKSYHNFSLINASMPIDLIINFMQMCIFLQCRSFVGTSVYSTPYTTDVPKNPHTQYVKQIHFSFSAPSLCSVSEKKAYGRKYWSYLGVTLTSLLQPFLFITVTSTSLVNFFF